MSLLDSARAKEWLSDADVTEADVGACVGNVRAFLERYLPCFYRKEQHELADKESSRAAWRANGAVGSAKSRTAK